MSDFDRLHQHRVDRDSLLARIIAALEADQRVAAAWLTGSLGKGNADEWSDIDLWIGVDDVALSDVLATQTQIVSAVGTPILIEEAPQNAPAGGGYMAVLYAGSVAPLTVDWYWVGASSARLPSDSRVLFMRANVLAETIAPPLTPTEHEQVALAKSAFIWMMIGITAKKIARRQSWAALRLIEMTRLAVEEVRWHLDKRIDPPDHRESTHWSDMPPVTPADQLANLRQMADQMDELMVDQNEISGSIRMLLALVEETLR
jgi:hypothetical protein